MRGQPNEVRASAPGLPLSNNPLLGSLFHRWYSVCVAERKGFIMAHSTFTITRVAVLANGRSRSTVEATGFASKREAQAWLGLAFYFPETRNDERSVSFAITPTRD